MRRAVVIAFLGLTASGFCLDEFLPVEKGKFELSTGYSFTNGYERYDSAGNSDTLFGNTSPSYNTVPLQLKYGVMPGLDVEFAWTAYSFNKDAGDKGGFGQPDLAVKYSLFETGLGAFVNLSLPLVTGDLDSPTKPSTGWTFGALYDKRFKNFRATGVIDYRVNSENEDKLKPGNQFLLFLKPEMLWTKSFGTYLGWKYESSGKVESKGHSLPYYTESSLTTLSPGFEIRLLKWLVYEINLPFTVSGSGPGSGNATLATWGLWGLVHMTFPK